MWTMLRFPGGQGETASVWLASLMQDMPEYRNDPNIANAGACLFAHVHMYGRLIKVCQAGLLLWCALGASSWCRGAHI